MYRRGRVPWKTCYKCHSIIRGGKRYCGICGFDSQSIPYGLNINGLPPPVARRMRY